MKPDRRELSWEVMHQYGEMIARAVAQEIVCSEEYRRGQIETVFLHGIPRGGIHAALIVQGKLGKYLNNVEITLTNEPAEADFFIDDILDSGKTKAEYQKEFPTVSFYVLFDKQERKTTDWIVFPWEVATGEKQGPTENIRRVLEFIGEDPNREGLRETPQRVLAALHEMTAGMRCDPKEFIKTFEANYDEMVVERNIEFNSLCEHHMLPFTGKAHIAYIPAGKVIGISKLARIVDVFARRLQIQERLTVDITMFMEEHLKPKGSACVIEAMHTCMSCRGVRKQSAELVTSSLLGAFREDPRARDEFLRLIGK